MKNFLFLGCLIVCVCAVRIGSAEDTIDYNRDIRPILSDTCYKCHGPDEAERKADLRLDLEEPAFAARDGGAAVVRGNSGESLLYQRVSAADADERMPPPDSGKSLSPEQIERLKRWIDQDAKWSQHWSFVRPVRPQPPATKHADLVRNAIDHFVFARLTAAGLEPMPAAGKERLIRRVTLDLTGLPPTIQEVDDFLADDSPQAYERIVDRLLMSTRYGEHLARYWLDAARYGDTHGLHLDNERSIWPYRDWVIRAWNENKAFDQFTIEQLAGDLLPNPTLEQRIATGFNRCNVTTSEGGSIAEEYLVRYAVDRVETTATVWMGMTAGCAVCHDHKFDPLSQKEFYQLFSYFYSLTEQAMDGNALLPPPIMKVPSPEHDRQQQALKQQITAIERQIREAVANVEYKEPEAATEPINSRRDYVWIEDGPPAGSKSQGDTPWMFSEAGRGPVLSGERASTRTATGRSQHLFTKATPGLKIGSDDVLFAYVYLDAKNPPREIMLQFNDGNWEHRAIWGEDLIDWGKPGQPSRLAMGPLPEADKWVRLEVPASKVGLNAGAILNGWAFTQFDGTVYWDKAGLNTQTLQGDEQFESLLAWERQVSAADNKSDIGLPKHLQDILKIDPAKRLPNQRQQVTNYFIEHAYSKTRSVLAPLRQQIDAVRKQLEEVENSLPSTLVMEDMPKPRQAYLLVRGQYDQPGEPVSAGVPSVFPALPEAAPPNRLALAKWLVDPAHPLTARVTVNRFWQQLFGTGIVKTSEDFGSQGEWPSHQQLLDWLAVDFIESGWNVKRMFKLMVMSHAYRQSARITPEALEKDPHNRLLSRGPRFRLDAETVRDNALFISGLLSGKIGGKSVRPYQPAGLWKAVGYSGSNTVSFKQDHGDALYRRSMYTFWKRTAPPPTMQILDAPSREYCVVRRERTNTPKAALALLNDVQFVEAARQFAARIMQEGGQTAVERVTYGFRCATARTPDAEEVQVLVEVFNELHPIYQKDQEAAVALLSIGESDRDKQLDTAQHAAWTIVANTLLNLDETITK